MWIQPQFQDLLLILYFTVFTGLAIMGPTMTDRPISAKRIFANPEVYRGNLINPPVPDGVGTGRAVMGTDADDGAELACATPPPSSTRGLT